jgi:hypothetical protein
VKITKAKEADLKPKELDLGTDMLYRVGVHPNSLPSIFISEDAFSNTKKNQ